jgi:hypothetical protein
MCEEDELFEILKIIVLVCSVVSGIASVVIIALYLGFKELRGPSFRVLLYMSLTDLVRSIFLAFRFLLMDSRIYCKISGLVTNATISVNAVWSVYICFMLRQMFHYFPEKPELYTKTWAFIAFFIVPSIQVFPLLTDSYGENQMVCTYKDNVIGIIWRSCQYSLIFLAIFVSILYYFREFFRYKHLKILTIREVIFEKGMIYSIIYLVTISAICIYRFSEFWRDFCEIYGLSFMSNILVTLHGFLNFLALFNNKNIRKTIFRLCCRKMERLDSDEIIISIINSSFNS